MKRVAYHSGKKTSAADRAAARRLLSILKHSDGKRALVIKKIRRSVRLRTYENELKLSVAVDRMIKLMAG